VSGHVEDNGKGLRIKRERKGKQRSRIEIIQQSVNSIPKEA
jgi:hypothetical protein